MKQKGAWILSAVFTAALAAAGLCTWLLPQRTFSPNENRVLQTTPKVSGKGVLDGTVQQEITDFMNDQFPLRDVFTGAGSLVKKWLGRRDIGGAYLGKDGYYFEKILDGDLSMTRYRQNLQRIAAFADAHETVPMTVAPVPDAGTVLTEKLPAFAQYYDPAPLYETAQVQLPARVRLLDLRKTLKEASAKETVFYRTDHHWTTYGAGLAFAALTGQKAPAPAELQVVSEAFYGTLYSKTLDVAARPDTVTIRPVADTVSATADGKTAAVYDMAAAEEKDVYRVFQGGNHGLVTFTGGCQNGRTLLLIKDSFANCLAPMLTAEYETVLMVDLRYYAGSVETLMTEQSVDEVWFLYELSNLARDTHLAKLTDA